MWDEREQERLLPLVKLSQKLSQLFMGFNSSAPALSYLTVEGGWPHWRRRASAACCTSMKPLPYPNIENNPTLHPSHQAPSMRWQAPRTAWTSCM